MKIELIDIKTSEVIYTFDTDIITYFNYGIYIESMNDIFYPDGCLLDVESNCFKVKGKLFNHQIFLGQTKREYKLK